MRPSQVKNRHYSVVHFDCITVANVLYLQPSVKGRAVYVEASHIS